MIQYNTYILLFISVISLWFSFGVTAFRLGMFHSVRFWQVFVVITLISAFVGHFITIRGVIGIVVFYLILQQYKHRVYNNESEATRWYTFVILWLLAVGFALLFYLHKVPEFHNLLVMDKIKLTPDAMPYTMRLNLDSTIVGIMIIGMVVTVNQNFMAWRNSFRAVIIFFPLVAAIILGLNYWFNYIILEPKIVSNLLLWSINNLFFVCFAEEALFRGFIQNSLSRFNYPYAAIIAIFITAILLGLLRISGGIQYAILATVAGILYGYVYYKTKSIEASILTHFLVNLTHILLFTYPALHE